MITINEKNAVRLIFVFLAFMLPVMLSTFFALLYFPEDASHTILVFQLLFGLVLVLVVLFISYAYTLHIQIRFHRVAFLKRQHDTMIGTTIPLSPSSVESQQELRTTTKEEEEREMVTIERK